MLDHSYAPAGAAMIEPWLLVEEITHRVANEYAAAIASISLAAARCAHPDARTALAGAARRLLDHADVHRALQPPPAGGPVDLSRHLRELCGAMVRASLAERNIHLTPCRGDDRDRGGAELARRHDRCRTDHQRGAPRIAAPLRQHHCRTLIAGWCRAVPGNGRWQKPQSETRPWHTDYQGFGARTRRTDRLAFRNNRNHGAAAFSA